MGLYIYEPYRTPEQQKIKFQETYQRYRDKISDKDELEKYVRRCTAGVGGGHQTGGAVDLTLCNKDGIPLDMGSEYPIKCPEMVTSYQIIFYCQGTSPTALQYYAERRIRQLPW